MAKTKLADYEAKRDFTRTDEPSGKVNHSFGINSVLRWNIHFDQKHRFM